MLTKNEKSGTALTPNHTTLETRMNTINQMLYVPSKINSLVIPW